MAKRPGTRAEERACRLLRREGYQIVARNWRGRFGEIDIVAREGAIIVFVEVKARSGDGFGGPRAAVDAAKQRRIALTAAEFLQATGCELAARFDVVTFSGSGATLLRNAFWVG